jgi:2-oxoglutarate ferredoxin oxidoreductase subunit beta
LVLEGLKPKDVLFCFDIGCNGNGSDKIGSEELYTLHGLHGRVIPIAGGAALANANMKVIASGGDGGTLSEGINHLVHGVRTNYPMVFILHNNENYGLTTGQASATSRKGWKMNATPDGVLFNPLNACEFVLGLKPTFVARSFSSDVSHMTDVLRAALNHKGFAFVELIQACPTYNRQTTLTWYQERVQDLSALKGYKSSDLEMAKKAAADMEKKINIGVLYQDKKSVPYQEMLVQRQGKKTTLVEEVKHYDISQLMKGLE